MGEGADGHLELIEEANVAKHHQPIAGQSSTKPILDRHCRHWRYSSCSASVNADISRQGSADVGRSSYSGLHLTDPEPMVPSPSLSSRSIPAARRARRSRASDRATSHEAGQLRRPAISIHQRDRKQRTHHQLTVPAELYILPVGVKPGPLLRSVKTGVEEGSSWSVYSSWFIRSGVDRLHVGSM